VPIHASLDSQCPKIMADNQQLRQVLHNLLQNAQDATEGRAEREVTVRTQWNEAGKRVRLMVQDTGSGFPDHILKRAFEPYVTTKAKGTGLGLAVVKKIADEHGARVDLKNRVEDGTVQGAQVSLSFAVAA
jgi:nitrogen fixation/metabolism regulation signal transduction histidine kinase